MKLFALYENRKYTGSSITVYYLPNVAGVTVCTSESCNNIGLTTNNSVPLLE